MRKRDKIALFVKTIENLKDLLEIQTTDLKKEVEICPCCLRQFKK